MIFLYIALCIFPLVVMSIVFALKVDGFRIRHSIICVVLGTLSLVVISLVQTVSEPFFKSVLQNRNVLLRTVIFNGGVEEGIKMLFLLLAFLARTRVRRTSMTPVFATVFSALVGLTVGCFESLIYFVAGQQTIILRLCTSTLIHVFCAILSGLFAYRCLVKINGFFRFSLFPFFYAVIIHGIYNFFALRNDNLWYFSLAVIFLALSQASLWYKKTISCE
ncbi:MAG: hypothetical protein Ta2A_21170 [Treponemataceae bacterium]|nr:MAG: hypothetical protein Ta2A_21170 [Treponemataceae bacterium]